MEAIAVSGGLGVLWNEYTLEVQLISQDRHWQCIKIFSKPLNATFFMLNLYGPNSIGGKEELWQNLTIVLNADNEAIFLGGGYFNAILHPLDKKGSIGWVGQAQ